MREGRRVKVGRRKNKWGREESKGEGGWGLSSKVATVKSKYLADEMNYRYDLSIDTVVT